MADTDLESLSARANPLGTDILYLVDPITNLPYKATMAQLDNYVGPFRRAITTAQTIASGADTYVTESRLLLPLSRMQAGVVFRGRYVLTKTAAGVAAPVFNLRVGTAGTTADVARLTYTGVAQTAVADVGYVEFQATFRSYGAAGILASWLRFDHDLAATGFANATRGFQGQAVSAAFDMTTASMGIGISLNPGASASWTVQQGYGELVNLVN